MSSLGLGLCLLAVLGSCAYYLAIARQDSFSLRSAADYFLYRRSLGPGGVFGTFYASGMSLATVFIAFLQLAPILGARLVWSVILYPLGHVALWLAIPRVQELAGGNRTIHGVLAERFDSDALRIVASVATTLAFIGVFATELIVGTTFFQSLLGGMESYWAVLVFLCIVVIAYSILGGFKSVVRTDAVQSYAVIALCLALPFLAAIFGKDPGGSVIEPHLMESWLLPPLLLINFFLINVPFPLVDMSAWQRVVAARDKKAARRGIGSAVVAFVITWSLILYSALAVAEHAGEDSAGGLSALLGWVDGLTTFGPIFAALITAALIAAMLSTADTFLIAASQTVSMDLQDRGFFANEHTAGPTPVAGASTMDLSMMPARDRLVISRARKRVTLLAFVGLVVCALLTRIGFKVADLVFAVYGSSLALLPATGLALSRLRRDVLSRFRRAAVLSVVGGFVAGWFYGVVAVLSSQGGPWLRVATAVNLFPGSPSAYNAPTVSFMVSALVLLVVAAPTLIGLAASRRKAT